MAHTYLPGFGVSSIERFPASPDSDRSTAQTVAKMAAHIRRAVEDPAIERATADALGSELANAPGWHKARAIFDWVKRHITFETDERLLQELLGADPDSELLIRPEMLLRFRRGDCDDFAMLTCAMLLRAGVPCGLVTIAADGQEPHRFSHVYAQALLDGVARMAMDTSHGPYAGWEAPRPFRRQEWPV
jgi:transglutaminase-like putative cysteine protease